MARRPLEAACFYQGGYMSRMHVLATGLVALLGIGSAADAAVLFKGIAVVTARTASSAACVAEFDIGESFVVEYRANIGTESAPENAMAIGPNGAILITSSDANPSLRGAGQVLVRGVAYAQFVQIPNANSNLAIVPATITSTTLNITVNATVANLGIPGCTVSFRSSMTKMLPGGF